MFLLLNHNGDKKIFHNFYRKSAMYILKFCPQIVQITLHSAMRYREIVHCIYCPFYLKYRQSLFKAIVTWDSLHYTATPRMFPGP